MSQGHGREVPIAEAERVWEDITSSEGPQITLAGDEHLGVLASTYDQATEMVYGRSWGRSRFARHTLAVSDAPECGHLVWPHFGR